MKKIKAIYKILCITILIGVVLCFQNSNIINVSRATNDNPNKNVDLNAMAKVIENFQQASLNKEDSLLRTLLKYRSRYLRQC